MGMRIALVLVATFALPAFVGGQSSSPAAADERPRFETASLKPNRSPEFGRNNRFSPGRFAYVNTPLEDYISNAYRFPSDRVLGMPDWARREKFELKLEWNPDPSVTRSPEATALATAAAAAPGERVNIFDRRFRIQLGVKLQAHARRSKL